MKILNQGDPFPYVSLADEDGLLALGGTLSPQRLLTAYQSGIFPWFSGNQPVLWWSPDPRMVLYLKDFKISKSLRQKIKSNRFKVTFNTAFAEVIQACAQVKRKGETGTWITKNMQQAYIELHNLGVAKSVEIWENDLLVGGLYGIDLPEKKVFCGESMFHKITDGSKIALYYLVDSLKKKDYLLIDCQVHTQHLESMGAKEISRETFISILTK
jgi:leucyl/phenylalanyl-tRNA--protein transferase